MLILVTMGFYSYDHYKIYLRMKHVENLEEKQGIGAT